MRHLFSLSLVVLTACGDGSGPSDAIPAALAGSWEASPACTPECHFTLVSIADPSQSVDFVSGLGATFLLDVTRSGGFQLTAPAAGATIQGTARAEGSLLILRDNAGVQDTADWSISGEHLTLGFRGVSEEFDFDGDQVADAAAVTARFRRR